jgi:hypothetical protein
LHHGWNGYRYSPSNLGEPTDNQLRNGLAVVIPQH